MTDEDQERMNVASTGLLGTASRFLDEHFEACRPSYEAMLHSVGLQAGWRVLDAACGAGSFLPLMSRLVGPTGSITAFDLANDNVATVQARIATGEFVCPVESRAAALTALPYADEEFDAVWCANALMYLDDGELARALAEFARVLRPGGLAAIKDADGGLFLRIGRSPKACGTIFVRRRSSRNTRSKRLVVLTTFRCRLMRWDWREWTYTSL